MASNQKILTPQEIMQQAVTAVNNVSGMNPTAKAEAAVALADAVARLHAATQQEVKNLMAVVDNDNFAVSVRNIAAEKVIALLGLQG